MAAPALKSATYEDVLNAPENMVAELVHGVLYTHPRPRSTHASSATFLSGELHGPFRRGRGGPGGWIFLNEPELHLGSNVLVPDLSGWRRERMPELPIAPAISTPPDWVCEVLSPSTAAMDRSVKLPMYASQGVTYAWLLDPDARTLEVLKLDGRTYRLLETHAGDAEVRAEPFEVFTLQLADLWSR